MCLKKIFMLLTTILLLQSCADYQTDVDHIDPYMGSYDAGYLDDDFYEDDWFYDYYDYDLTYNFDEGEYEWELDYL